MAANSVEEAMRTKVLSLSGVTSYIGTGSTAAMFWVHAPQGSTQAPLYMTYDTPAATAIPGSIGQRNGQARIQFSIWANYDTREQGMNLANNLIAGINQFSGASDGYQIDLVETIGPMGPLRDPDYEGTYQIIVDAEVDYERST